MLQTIWVHCQCWNSRWVFALWIGGAYRSSVFAAKGFVCGGPSNSSFVSSHTHPHLCAAVWALELLKRAPSHQFSNWDMSNLGYEGKRVFVLREIRNDNRGAGVVLVTARSRMVWRWEKHSTLYWIRKTKFFHLWADESLCTVSHEIQSRVISFQVFSKEHDVFWELHVWMLPCWRSAVTRKVERKGQQPYEAIYQSSFSCAQRQLKLSKAGGTKVREVHAVARLLVGKHWIHCSVYSGYG